MPEMISSAARPNTQAWALIDEGLAAQRLMEVVDAELSKKGWPP